MENIARTRGHESLEAFLRSEPRAFLEEYANVAGRTRPGIFKRLFNWSKRLFTWGGLYSIFKLGVVGLGLWGLYELFTDEGWKLDESENSNSDGSDGEGGDTGTGGSDGEGGDTGTGGSDESVFVDSQGNKYTECQDRYFKGCVTEKGNDSIKKAQKCFYRDWETDRKSTRLNSSH